MIWSVSMLSDLDVAVGQAALAFGDGTHGVHAEVLALFGDGGVIGEVLRGDDLVGVDVVRSGCCRWAGRAGLRGRNSWRTCRSTCALRGWRGYRRGTARG